LTLPDFRRKLRAWQRNPGLNQPPGRQDAKKNLTNSFSGGIFSSKKYFFFTRSRARSSRAISSRIIGWKKAGRFLTRCSNLLALHLQTAAFRATPYCLTSTSRLQAGQ
jgi:hypothetical protein